MLSYIATSLPHCVGKYNNILPQNQSSLIPIYINNEVKYVHIIIYFVLRNQMHLARHVLNISLDSMIYMDIYLITPEQIFELLSNIEYTEDQAVDIINLLDGLSHEKLNPLMSYLCSIAKRKRIVGYTHITKYVPDYDYYEYYDIKKFYNNYPEAEYIVSLLDANDRKQYCKQALKSGNIDFNAADVRYLKLLVDNCDEMGDNYYSLAYAIVYNKFTGEYEGLIIPQFLYNVYNNSENVRMSADIDNIIHLERLITTKERRKLLYRIIEKNHPFLPKKLPPKIHKQAAKYCIERSKPIPLQLDDCKYCQRITQI